MTSEVVDAGDGLPLTIPALLRARAATQADDVFVVVDDDRLTYGEADERSARLARGLLAMGTAKGTHVAMLFPNTVDFAVTALAVTRIGAVAVPFSTFSTAAELRGLLAGADAEMLLATPTYRNHDFVERIAEVLPAVDLASGDSLHDVEVPTLRGIHFTGDGEGLHPTWTTAHLLERAREVGTDALEAAETAVTPADSMVIIHTSGSTSAPKGVVHAHGPLIRHQDNLNELRRYMPGEVLYSPSPWFWIGGFAYALLGTLVAGARLVTSSAAEASAVLDVLERERPTIANGFAQSVAHLPDDPTFAARDLSSIRRGNLWPIMPDDVRPTDPLLRHSMLGMTEAGSVCLAGPPDADDDVDLPAHQRGSFGGPVPGFEARIVDPDTGADCATGEIGELLLRGPFLMEGYHGRDRSEAFDEGGWFHTGDLFHVDDDGLHYFHGRAGLMIKTGGANVSPLEVEAAFAELGHRAHVLGLEDDERGQVVAAAVVADDDVDVDALRTALRERLSAYKVPKVFLVLGAEEIPMMSSGKLDQRALRERFDRELESQ